MIRYLLFLLFALNIALNGQIALGYYYASRDVYPHTAIDYSQITHIAHAFISCNGDGSLLHDSWFFYPELITATHNNGKKIIVTIGGWSYSSGLSPMSSTPATRKTFINNITNFCKQHGYDGVDFDWEPPSAKDRDNFSALIKELRHAFDSSGVDIISSALYAVDWENAYDINALKDNLSWFGLMTFNYSGSWSSTAYHNSALFSAGGNYLSVDYSVQEYLKKGMPKNKLCIGIPFYGVDFKATELYGFIDTVSAKDTKTLLANEIEPKLLTGYNYFWDETCKVPYLQDDARSRVIVYEDSNSVKLKCEYVKKNNLAGAIIWRIGADYYNNKTPLLDMIGKYLLNYPLQAPSVPVHLFPFSGELVDSNNIMFSWNASDCATSYNLQIDTTLDFTNPIINKTGISLNYVAVSSFKYNQKYFWRIRSSNLSGNSNWSVIWEFSIKESPTDVSEDIEQKHFSLTTYPNPFNPSINIMFNLPERSRVQVVIYDSLGKEVTKLLDDDRVSGTYKLTYKPSFIAGGIYICRLIAGNVSLSKKIVFMK